MELLMNLCMLLVDHFEIAGFIILLVFLSILGILGSRLLYISFKKDKKKSYLSKQEEHKMYFFNLWLPLIILLLYILLRKGFSIIFNPLSFIFCVVYCLYLYYIPYHLLYYLFTKKSSYKYYGNKTVFIVYFIFCIFFSLIYLGFLPAFAFSRLFSNL